MFALEKYLLNIKPSTKISVFLIWCHRHEALAASPVSGMMIQASLFLGVDQHITR